MSHNKYELAKRYNLQKYDAVGRLLTFNGKLKAIAQDEVKAKLWAEFMNRVDVIRMKALDKQAQQSG